MAGVEIESCSAPHPAQPRYVQQSLAAREARFHPLILRSQLTAAARACEGPALSIDGPDIADELPKVMRKAADSPGSASVATVPGTQVCTDQVSG